jgi:hypothetical protein
LQLGSVVSCQRRDGDPDCAGDFELAQALAVKLGHLVAQLGGWLMARPSPARRRCSDRLAKQVTLDRLGRG